MEQTTQNTVKTSTHITKTPTHKKQVKTNTVQDTHQMKYNTIKCPQYKVTVRYMIILSTRNSP